MRARTVQNIARPGLTLERMNLKNRIETLTARGISQAKIAEETGSSLGYIKNVLRFASASARPVSDGCDCELHLKLIRKANKGRTFPIYPAELIERAGL